MTTKRVLALVLIALPLFYIINTIAPLNLDTRFSRQIVRVSEKAPVKAARFALIGDYGDGGKNEEDVANLVKSWKPDFIVTAGDNNYPNGAADTIDKNIGQYYHDFLYPYNGAYGSGSSEGNKFFPSLGNHDWVTPGARPYLDYFTLPNNERYYDFVTDDIHLFIIDSNPDEPDGVSANSVQGQWLKKKLADAKEKYKIVVFHHAPYTSGITHGNTTFMQWPFKEWGASLVISGHEHLYERLEVDGLPYLIVGSSGYKNLYPFGTPVAGSKFRYNGHYGALLVETTGDELVIKFINTDNIIIDTLTVI